MDTYDTGGKLKMSETKKCGKCGVTKPRAEFYKASKQVDGCQGYCKVCSVATVAAWALTPLGRQRYRDFGFRSGCGLTREEFGIKVIDQHGGCACCGDVLVPGRETHVDHDHTCCGGRRPCGKCFRGVLCRACNLMLGHAKDDPARLRAGIAYLEATRLRAVA